MQKGGAGLSQGAVPKKSPHMAHPKTALRAGQHQGPAGRQNIGPSQRTGAFARANARELGEAGLSTQERERLHDVMRTIPRVANVGTTIRIDATVPRSVREAAAPLPPEVQRMHPRLRHGRVFIHGDQVVILNPATSRIVAIVKKRA